MSIKKFRLVLPLLFIILALSACSELSAGKIHITDAKIAAGVDEKLMPVRVTDVFPKGTRTVFCWFKWKDAEINTPIIAKWYFVTDDIHVLDYTFKITRKEGAGNVSLSMPEGKLLPSGSYRLDLMLGGRKLKSRTFEVK